MNQVITTPGFDASILVGQLSPSSIKMYQRDFHVYLAFAGTKEAALTPTTLARWRKQLADGQMSPNTINRMLSTIKSLMMEAAAQGFISHELAEEFRHIRGVKIQAMKEQCKEKVWLEPEQVRMLCEAPGTTSLKGLRDTALLHTLASSGLRASEVASLKISQVKMKGREYIIEVCGKNETVPTPTCISQEAVNAIQDWIDARPLQSEYLFTGFQGRGGRLTDEPMTPKSVWWLVKTYAEACGIGEVYTHALRAFVGTVVEEQYGIRKAQEVLRHKHIKTTADHYIKPKVQAGLTNNLY